LKDKAIFPYKKEQCRRLWTEQFCVWILFFQVVL